MQTERYRSFHPFRLRPLLEENIFHVRRRTMDRHYGTEEPTITSADNAEFAPSIFQALRPANPAVSPQKVVHRPSAATRPPAILIPS